MKWGVRRKPKKKMLSFKETVDINSQYIKNQQIHPILSSIAIRDSINADKKTATKVRRILVYQKTAEIKDINSRVDIMIAKKQAKKSLKKIGEQKIEELYREALKNYIEKHRVNNQDK
jgi:hypothetical protein